MSEEWISPRMKRQSAGNSQELANGQGGGVKSAKGETICFPLSRQPCHPCFFTFFFTSILLISGKNRDKKRPTQPRKRGETDLMGV
jgi:hypothetical protein